MVDMNRGQPPPRTVTSRAPFDGIAALANSTQGALLLAGWAAGEALVVPVVPDVLLCLYLLAAPRRLAVLFTVLLAGALAGTALLFLVASASPGTASSLVLAVPGVTSTMLDSARAVTAAGDPFSIAGIGPGTPLKVYTVAWAGGAGGPLSLAIGVLVNRITRIGPDAVVAAILGLVAPGFVRRHPGLVLILYAVFWLGVYWLYLG